MQLPDLLLRARRVPMRRLSSCEDEGEGWWWLSCSRPARSPLSMLFSGAQGRRRTDPKPAEAQVPHLSLQGEVFQRERAPRCYGWVLHGPFHPFHEKLSCLPQGDRTIAKIPFVPASRVWLALVPHVECLTYMAYLCGRPRCHYSTYQV